MSIKVFVELKIKQEKLSEIPALFEKFLVDTRSIAGNEGVSVYSDQETPTTIVLVEQWHSREHYTKYNQWRAARGDLARLFEFIEVPPQRRFFDYFAV